MLEGKEGTVLNAEGSYWAIANEISGGSNNVATYNVKGSAKATLTSYRDSTIYTVAAQITMNVDSPGEFKLIHNGGLYGLIFLTVLVLVLSILQVVAY